MSIHPDIERVALLGWRVYPQSKYTKAACIKHGSDLATCDLTQIDRWDHEFKKPNWRVVFSGSGIWALDLDVPPSHANHGIAALKNLVDVHGPLPPRPVFRSGGGGLGLFFRYTDERIIGDSNCPAPGIDPRRGRQSLTLPPSRHWSTKQPYRWLISPWEITPPPAPAWLLKLVAPPEVTWRRPVIDTTDAARERLYRAAQAIIAAQQGSRNDTLNRRAFQVGRYIAAGLIDEREGIEVLYGAARSVGLEHMEAHATIKSGVESGLRHAG